MIAAGVKEREATHEQVVTMALSFKGARQLRELHRRQKSIITVMVCRSRQCGCRETGKARGVELVQEVEKNQAAAVKSKTTLSAATLSAMPQTLHD
jgi:hypothetical protein